MVSVIVVNGGIKEYLKSCLDSLKTQIYSSFEIVVSSNSSVINFNQELLSRYPDIKLVVNSENLFYCAAMNKGIRISQGDFVLCLNDDVVLDKGFIQEAMKSFLIDSKIGMVSGKILRSDGKTIDSTGLFLTPWRSAEERGYGIKDRGQFEKEGYIFGVNGAVAFFRREMLERIKAGDEYFDEDYRIFYEDLDIAWRAQNSGWKAYYTPKAIAYHVRGGTVRCAGGKDRALARRFLKEELLFDLVKNRCLTIIKNESCISLLLRLPLILCYDLLSWGYILLFRPRLIKKIFPLFSYFKKAFLKRKTRPYFLSRLLY